MIKIGKLTLYNKYKLVIKLVWLKLEPSINSIQGNEVKLMHIKFNLIWNIVMHDKNNWIFICLVGCENGMALDN